MDLRELRNFVVIADTLNFSRASEVLFLSQSTLSKQIAELEEELGVTLFIRDKRKVEITPAGRMLRAEAEKLLQQADRITPMVQSMTKHPENSRMLIGIDAKAMSESTFRKILTESVYMLRKQNPGIQASIMQMEYPELQDHLLAGDLDMAFVLERPAAFDARFTVRLLWEDEMVLALRATTQYNEEDIPQLLLKQDLLMIERENRGLSHIVQILNDMGISANIRFCKNRESMLLCMESGDGIAMLPRSVIRMLSNPELQVFSLPSENSPMYLMGVWSVDRANPLRDSLLGYVDRYTEVLT